MFDILFGVFCIILTFIAFNFLIDSVENFIFGCGRKFKNGRKCRVWHCPNCTDCPFFFANNANNVRR